MPDQDCLLHTQAAQGTDCTASYSDKKGVAPEEDSCRLGWKAAGWQFTTLASFEAQICTVSRQTPRKKCEMNTFIPKN